MPDEKGRDLDHWGKRLGDALDPRGADPGRSDEEFERDESFERMRTEEQWKDDAAANKESTERLKKESSERLKTEMQRAEAAGLATWLYRALNDPATWIRLAGAGLGALGLFLLMQGLNAQAPQVPGASVTPAPTTAVGSPTTQASPGVTGNWTATASFTKISGGAGFPNSYNARYSLDVTNNAATLIQDSPKHTTTGTIEQVAPNVFRLRTMAQGQSYDALITGKTVEGTNNGPGYAYTFKGTLNEALGGVAASPPAAASASPAQAAPTTTGTSGERNIPLAMLGVALLVGAGGLLLGGSRLAGGPVLAKPRDDEDPSQIVVTAALPAEEPGWWSRLKEFLEHLVDVVAEGTGTPPPFKAAEIVDVVVDATPSIMETKENVEEYRENVHPDEDTLGIYNNLDDVPAKPTLSQRFFKWINSLVP